MTSSRPGLAAGSAVGIVYRPQDEQEKGDREGEAAGRALKEGE